MGYGNDHRFRYKVMPIAVEVDSRDRPLHFRRPIPTSSHGAALARHVIGSAYKGTTADAAQRLLNAIDAAEATNVHPVDVLGAADEVVRIGEELRRLARERGA